MERYNIVVIGAGSGGLVVAAGAAGLGARVALVEKHRMGGDCLNTGCVPSKALLASAKALQHAREGGRFGLNIPKPGPQDWKAVQAFVRSAQARIAPHDSVERFTGLGVEVFQGRATLKSPHEVEVNGQTLWGRHLVVATGSRPAVPPIPGLVEAEFLTNESVFEIAERPESLLVMGGGPIGTELGQAFARLGTNVTIVSSTAHICAKEDPDVAAVLAATLRGEGVTILDESRATRVALRDGKKVVTVARAGGAGTEVAADEILVAVGRTANVDGLGLEAAGVIFSKKGVEIDSRCRTNVPSVWAVGDVAGGPLFTHWAGHQARVVIRNVLFPGSTKHDLANLPWTTFTEPEIAHVGLNETRAKEGNVPHRVFKVRFDDVDRSVCDGEAGEHFAKVVAGPKGEILGATIVHPHAGDLLAELVLARKHGITLASLSRTIHTYPGLSEVNRALGDAFLRTKLTTGTKARLTRVFRWLRQ
ncbi:MAG: FAD-dependent oxidoreductase [Holophagales bacterium]|nr:FAD-dependent oxidoreductase [Holophagales bacterium]